jgi:monovalent cation/hydrogen antiporter
MHLTTTVLLLLLITAVTNLVVTAVRVPLPLLQIAVGALCDLLGFHVSFDPSLFLLLFIPPLLFADAYRIPKRELSEVGVPVVALAFGLVLFTVRPCRRAFTDGRRCPQRDHERPAHAQAVHAHPSG